MATAELCLTFCFHQDDPNLQVAIKSCKNPDSREKFLEEACEYQLCQSEQKGSSKNVNSNLLKLFSLTDNWSVVWNK